jgi:hypothetical protein
MNVSIQYQDPASGLFGEGPAVSPTGFSVVGLTGCKTVLITGPIFGTVCQFTFNPSGDTGASAVFTATFIGSTSAAD